MNSEDITANDMNAISSAPASTSILSNGLEGNNNISRSNGGSHTRPMIPLLDTVGAAVTSSLASESQQFSSSSKSERQSIKQRHLTPQDVSMPDLNGYAKHTPIELKPNNVYGGNNSSAAAGQSTEVFNNIAPSRVLDGFMLLEATGMGFPNDARQATLQGRKLQAVVEEDLIFYTGLLYLDVSDNLLNFQSFSVLPKLRELRIACNNIRDIGDLNCTSFGHQSNVQMANSLANPSVSSPIPQHGGGFAKLLYLDLSYNRLTIDSVRSLYAIDTLIELDLTGNNLKNVPLDMYLFQKLERLNLSRNKLQENNSVFVSCGSIYYLRHLNLSYNFLSQVPMQAVNSPHPHVSTTT